MLCCYAHLQLYIVILCYDVLYIFVVSIMIIILLFFCRLSLVACVRL